ncbi:MAG: helix-turn-helix domain-containing protein [Candidatus Nanohaloarchaea archaeon]
MAKFNPFDVELDEVEWDDLYRLRKNGIAEGFYFEYKQEMVSNKKIAKVVSSFANTRGGLMFIGIEDNERNVPESFDGIDISGKGQPKEKIRSVVKAWIDPSPRFETYILRNPSNKDQAILMISVSKSHRTPHINKDGRIYKRTGEGSDPYEPIEDYTSLKDLHDRRKDWQDRVESFTEREVTNTKGQSDNSLLVEIFSVPTNLNDSRIGLLYEEMDVIKEILSQKSTKKYDSNALGPLYGERAKVNNDVSLETFRTVSKGMVAQKWRRYDQGKEDLAHAPESFKLLNDGSLKLFTPFKKVSALNVDAENDIIEGLEDSKDITSLEVVDGQEIVDRLTKLLLSYFELLEELGWNEAGHESLYIGIYLDNMFRTMVLFDEDWFKEYIEENGPPICYEDNMWLPRRTYVKIDELNDEKKLEKAYRAAKLVMVGFGINPNKIEGNYRHEFN